jgi:predicted enzyme related to lactoylglutathione lyase
MTGAIVHFEITGSNAGDLAKFYDAMFGWGADEWMPDYFGATTPEGSPDGAISTPSEEMTNGTVIYIEVPSIDEALAKIEAAGGKTKTPRTEIPDVVIYASFYDPAGNLVGLVEAS